ncbi:MAG: pyridoxine 5'-phosphate oxidase C-terminal domain-containing protein, partial [Pseudomonadota bacterium]
SNQSRPIQSRDALLQQLKRVEQKYESETEIPRPPHWGGYRLWPDTMELWVNGDDRLHDRGCWHRNLTLDKEGLYVGDPWTNERLQP